MRPCPNTIVSNYLLSSLSPPPPHGIGALYERSDVNQELNYSLVREEFVTVPLFVRENNVRVCINVEVFVY